MKIRLKYKNERSTLDVETTETLQQLRHQIASNVFPNLPSIWNFSLNGKDELGIAENSMLSDLGLVSGDLLHIFGEESEALAASGVVDPLHQQLLQMGFSQVNITKVTQNFGAQTLNDAVELLSMLGESSNQKLHNTSSSNQNVAFSTSANQCSSSSQASNERSTASSIPANQNANLASVANQKRAEVQATNQMDVDPPPPKRNLFIKPFLLSDGITDDLKVLVEETNCQSAADYLMLTIHAIVSETSLCIKKSSCATEEDKHPKSRLPEHWRIPDAGFYRINYIHPAMNERCFGITSTVTGNSIVVTGTVDIDDSKSYQVKLKIDDFVKKSNLDSRNCDAIYTNLYNLSTQIKYEVINKLLDEATSKCQGNNDSQSFQSLPEELKLQILYNLDVRSLCVMARTGHDMSNICQSETVWKKIIQRDFGTKCEEYSPNAYKRLKREERRAKEEMERQRREADELRNMRPEFIPMREDSPDYLRLVAPNSRIPGMIGGRYDLIPGQFPDIGAPRNDPLRIGQPRRGGNGIPVGRGIVPGARFDPYGPIPDDDDFPGGPPLQPDVLQRPRFGRGNGFGGGGANFGGGSGFI
ncbi:F-box only protein 7-like [Clytia hemisphaerica]